MTEEQNIKEAKRQIYDDNQYGAIDSFLRGKNKQLRRKSGDQNFNCVVDAINNSLGNAVFNCTWDFLARLNQTGLRNSSVIRNYAMSGYVKYLSQKPLVVVYHEFELKWLTTYSLYFMGQPQV